MLAVPLLPHGFSGHLAVMGFRVRRLYTGRYLPASLRRVLPVERQVQSPQSEGWTVTRATYQDAPTSDNNTYASLLYGFGRYRGGERGCAGVGPALTRPASG